MYKKSKRTMLLLEVLISLAIVALCLLPLISAHTSLYKANKQFTEAMQATRIANRIYVEILEQLHKNELPWGHIQGHQSQSLDSLLNKSGISKCSGKYQFNEVIFKQNKQTGWTMFQLALTLDLTFDGQSEHPHQFEYRLPILYHDLSNTKDDSAQVTDDSTKDKDEAESE